MTRSLTLPRSVQDYFSGKNARDIALAVSGFTDTAVVMDEGGQHTGQAAIRAWIEATTARYDDRASPRSAVTAGDSVDVIADVSGNFPGSPIALRFSFTISGGAIARLQIS